MTEPASGVIVTQSDAPESEIGQTTIEAVASLGGHHDRVWHVDPHPSLPIVATASSDRTVRIYSTRDWRQVGIVEGNHKRSIRSCAWKPGEPMAVLATASFDSTVGIWDCQGDEYTGEGEWECAGLLEGHENEVKSVAWSGSGTYLATCSRDKSIWIWDAENYEDPECAAVMQEHAQDVKCVVWHPSEELLASGSYDDEIRLWRDDGDDWTCVAVLAGHTGTVWALDFEKRDEALEQRLCSSSADGTVRVWRRTADAARKGKAKDALPSIIRPSLEQKWEHQATLPQVHQGDIYTVCWSRHSGRIASAGQDGAIVVYKERVSAAADGDDARSEWVVEAELVSPHGVHEVNHLAWGAGKSTDGELLYSAGDDGTARVWRVKQTASPIA